MAKPFTLETVRQVVRRRADDAGAVVRTQAARLEAARAKLDDLERFQGEYTSQRQAMLAQGGTGAQLREFDAFLARLAQAVGVQSSEVERARAAWTSAVNTWQEQQRQERAFGVLADRHAERERIAADRQEQKGQDEYAQRIHGRGQGAGE